MISGVEQVIGMKPILSSFFSSAFFSCAIAVNAASGRNSATAAGAVEAPTARRNQRRFASFGTRLRSAWTSSARAESRSGSVRTALRSRAFTASCSAWVACAPQEHAATVSPLYGLSRKDMRISGADANCARYMDAMRVPCENVVAQPENGANACLVGGCRSALVQYETNVHRVCAAIRCGRKASLLLPLFPYDSEKQDQNDEQA